MNQPEKTQRLVLLQMLNATIVRRPQLSSDDIRTAAMALGGLAGDVFSEAGEAKPDPEALLAALLALAAVAISTAERAVVPRLSKEHWLRMQLEAIGNVAPTANPPLQPNCVGNFAN